MYPQTNSWVSLSFFLSYLFFFLSHCALGFSLCPSFSHLIIPSFLYFVFILGVGSDQRTQVPTPVCPPHSQRLASSVAMEINCPRKMLKCAYSPCLVRRVLHILLQMRCDPETNLNACICLCVCVCKWVNLLKVIVNETLQKCSTNMERNKKPSSSHIYVYIYIYIYMYKYRICLDCKTPPQRSHAFTIFTPNRLLFYTALRRQ